MIFNRLRNRIVVFFLALLGLVQILAFVLVNAANSTNAHQKIESELRTGERVFARVLQQNREQLTQAARVLAADFAFREAIATDDVETVLSAMSNHGARINASMMVLVSLDGHVVADTLHPEAKSEPFAFQSLLKNARDHTSGSSIEILDEKAYQLVVVPVLAPVPIAWVVIGFVVDNHLALDLRQLTALDISFMTSDEAGRLHILATTLDSQLTHQLMANDGAIPRIDTETHIGKGRDEQQLRVIPIEQHGQQQIIAILQRSVAAATAVFDKLQNILLILGVGSLVLSLIGSAMIALNITKPLDRLADAAARIQGGDYSTPVRLKRSDEIGLLAASLDQMREGIAAREQEILRLAYEDGLTGLPNRALFNKWLTEAIDVARDNGTSVSILVMDLDRFKTVNDTLGHEAGDHVLREVTFRLSQLTTAAGTVARLGGDEFAILLSQSSAVQATELAIEIMHALESPISHQDQWLDVGTSIGIATFPAHGDDASTLLRHADIAMYAAKRGKAGFAHYDSSANTYQQKHLSLLSELRRAVETNELKLFYQPKVLLSRDEVSEAEALLRWNHPVRGFIPPNEFIPFAEHTGYIKELTQWVMQAAIRQCGEWVRRGMPLRISVNISPPDLLNRELSTTISKLLAIHQVPAELLCLEITESGFMEDPAQARSILLQLHEIGVRLSIDDYGTGYSSLSYIAQLPVDELKIDRAFIMNVATNSVAAAIVRSTIELGHNLGMSVVAEGVEDEAGFETLKQLGCDHVQGFFISKPLPADAFEAWLLGSGRRKAQAPQKSDIQDDSAQVA